MYKAVIFDLWQTLGTKNVGVSGELQTQFGILNYGNYLSEYEEAVQLQPWGSEEEMAKSFLSKFGVDQSPDNVSFVVDVFRQGVKEATLYDGIFELLNSLKQKGLKLGLLSNTTVFESAVLDNFGIKDLFDAVVLSWQNGHLKPSPESFLQVLGELGVTANEVVFVDDGIKNVEAARRLGMYGILFAGVDELRESLASAGL